jgi:hypothetical protein
MFGVSLKNPVSMHLMESWDFISCNANNTVLFMDKIESQ